MGGERIVVIVVVVVGETSTEMKRVNILYVFIYKRIRTIYRKKTKMVEFSV